MCMCIGTDYSAMCKLIWFCFDMLMHMHVLHILLIFQFDILNSFWVINLYVFLP